MVSKVAVIALVAIVACPILIGYAMNLNETTITEYKTDNNQMNVTQLLQTGTDWSIAQGDPYTMNSKALSRFTSYLNNQLPSYPIYNKTSTVKTSMPMYQTISNWNGGSDNGVIATLREYQAWCDYNVDDGKNVTLKLYWNNGNSNQTFTNVVYVRYSSDLEQITIYGTTHYPEGSLDYINTFDVPNIYRMDFTVTGGPIPLTYNYIPKSGTITSYADISEGFYFKKQSNRPNSWGWTIELPEKTFSALLSVNLDSITDSNYTVNLEQIGSSGQVQLEKTTTAGVVSWKLQKAYNGNPYAIQELYYNPDISDNTYQILFTATGDYTGHMQLRYIGHWQKTIGEANYYQTYDMDYTQMGAQGNTLDSISIVSNDTYTSRTPTLRIDAAKFRAYEYPVIEGTLDPASFKTNPSTKITNIEQYGTQLIFGGNTYNITNGNITLGTHQIPVRNIVLDSVPNADTLQYDNRINGTVVSTTANPSTIQFVGNWSANITVDSMQPTSYTKTEWVAGDFGWDGIDQNFLLCGLVTCVAAFIGCGIYAKKTGSGGIIPVMIVCGGAALMFFLML